MIYNAIESRKKIVNSNIYFNIMLLCTIEADVRYIKLLIVFIHGVCNKKVYSYRGQQQAFLKKQHNIPHDIKKYI